MVSESFLMKSTELQWMRGRSQKGCFFMERCCKRQSVAAWRIFDLRVSGGTQLLRSSRPCASRRDCLWSLCRLSIFGQCLGIRYCDADTKRKLLSSAFSGSPLDRGEVRSGMTERGFFEARSRLNKASLWKPEECDRVSALGLRCDESSRNCRSETRRILHV